MTTEELRPQFERARREGILADICRWETVGSSLLLAIGSRETGLTNELGDTGHGVGVMQIDDRFWSIAKSLRDSGEWRSASGRMMLIKQADTILRNNMASVRAAGVAGQYVCQVAVSAYNCGIHNAILGHYEGDCDAFTSGHNYSADVLGREAIFQGLLKEMGRETIFQGMLKEL